MRQNHTWRDGNSVELLINGEGFYPRVFECIRNAREEVLLETFIIMEDKIGRQLQQALIAAARAGARVEVMVDGYGTFDLSTPFLTELVDAGVTLRVFDPSPRMETSSGRSPSSLPPNKWSLLGLPRQSEAH